MKRWIHAASEPLQDDSQYVALMSVDDKPIGFYKSLLRDGRGSTTYVTRNLDKAKKFSSNKRKPSIPRVNTEWACAPHVSFVTYDLPTLTPKKDVFFEHYADPILTRHDRTIYALIDKIDSMDVQLIPLEEAGNIEFYDYDDFKYLDLINYMYDYFDPQE